VVPHYIEEGRVGLTGRERDYLAESAITGILHTEFLDWGDLLDTRSCCIIYVIEKSEWC